MISTPHEEWADLSITEKIGEADPQHQKELLVLFYDWTQKKTNSQIRRQFFKENIETFLDEEFGQDWINERENERRGVS